jgi:dCMP deaminase
MNREELKDATFMKMALNLMALSTCRRRKVGCILVDEKYRIIGSGVNGVPSGWDHCTDRPCPGAELASGTGLEVCQAIHAESNAVLQCVRPDTVWTAYCTTSPCMHCVKLLSNTGCTRIMFSELYVDKEPGRLWAMHGRVWVQI